MSKDNYQQDKKSAIGWVMGIVAILLTGGLGYVTTKIQAHDTAIAVGAEKQQSMEKRLDGMDAKLDKILDKLTKP
jgi:hypothetical protein